MSKQKTQREVVAWRVTWKPVGPGHGPILESEALGRTPLEAKRAIREALADVGEIIEVERTPEFDPE